MIIIFVVIVIKVSNNQDIYIFVKELIKALKGEEICFYYQNEFIIINHTCQFILVIIL